MLRSNQLAKTEAGTSVTVFLLSNFTDETFRFPIVVNIENADYRKGAARNLRELATMDEILDLLERPVHLHSYPPANPKDSEEA